MIARRRHPPLSSAASVATTAIVVLAPGRPCRIVRNLQGLARHLGSLVGDRSRRQALARQPRRRPLSGVPPPPAVDSDDRPNYGAIREGERGAADPAFEPPAVAPSPAPALPSANSLAAAATAPGRAAIGRLTGPHPRPGKPRSNRIAAGTIGTDRRADRKAAAPLGEPIHDPAAASRPKPSRRTARQRRCGRPECRERAIRFRGSPEPRRGHRPTPPQVSRQARPWCR